MQDFVYDFATPVNEFTWVDSGKGLVDAVAHTAGKTIETVGDAALLPGENVVTGITGIPLKWPQNWENKDYDVALAGISRIVGVFVLFGLLLPLSVRLYHRSPIGPAVKAFLSRFQADYHPGVPVEGRSELSWNMDKHRISDKQPWERRHAMKNGIGKERGFTNEEWLVLISTSNLKPRSYEELANRSGQEISTVKETVSRLRNRGMLLVSKGSVMAKYPIREKIPVFSDKYNLSYKDESGKRVHYHPGVPRKGRSKRSIIADRKKVSKQPWEQRYQKKNGILFHISKLFEQGVDELTGGA